MLDLSCPFKSVLGLSILHYSLSAKVDAVKLAITKTVSGLYLEDARGQSYDGCRAMAGKQNGVATIICKNLAKIPFVHCHSHHLNLCVMKAVKFAQVRDIFEYCHCIVEFSANCAKRLEFFAAILANSDIPKMNRRRW